jgi:AcrR family transcriptional regulator
VTTSPSSGTGFEPGGADAGLLDAARECVLAVGVRRTTFSDVARRAGVSRMTLYRRFPDLEALLSALMTREFGRLVEEERAASTHSTASPSPGTGTHSTAPPTSGTGTHLTASPSPGTGRARTGRERVVAMTTGACRRLAADPLFRRLLDVDPELLLPYVTVRLGGMQRIAVAAAAAELGASAADGSVRDGDPETMARAIELMARGFVLIRDPGLDVWEELGRAIDGYLRP